MKKITCVLAALAAALAAPALAAPTLQFVDNLDDSVTLQVVTDAAGSLGTEVAVQLIAGPEISLVSYELNSAVFDQAIPGDNPFIPGSLPVGDSSGFWSDFPSNRLFASFGAGDNGIGALDFITIGYSGSGSIQAGGYVAQAGLLGDFLTAGITVGGGITPSLPTIQFVDNGDGTVTLQIVTEQIGSTGTELAFTVEVGGTLSIDDAYVVDTATFDTENPGDNPFTGGVTEGLFTDFGANQVFASFGSGIIDAGTYDFLTLELSGVGTLSADGVVSQLGQLNGGLNATIGFVPEPGSALLAAIGLFGLARSRRD